MVDGPPERGDDDDAKAQERRRLVRRLAVVGPLVLGLLVILLLACVLWIPRWLYSPLTETDLHGVSDAAKVQELKGARLKLENDARTTLLQGLAAVLVLTGAGIGAAVTLRQIRMRVRASSRPRERRCTTHWNPGSGDRRRRDGRLVPERAGPPGPADRPQPGPWPKSGRVRRPPAGRDPRTVG